MIKCKGAFSCYSTNLLIYFFNCEVFCGLSILLYHPHNAIGILYQYPGIRAALCMSVEVWQRCTFNCAMTRVYFLRLCHPCVVVHVSSCVVVYVNVCFAGYLLQKHDQNSPPETSASSSQDSKQEIAHKLRKVSEHPNL